MNKKLQATVGATALMVCLFPAHQVLADAAGPNSPTAASTAQIPNSTGTWANPDNAFASDDNYATRALFGVQIESRSNLLWVRGFGFTIPSDATVNGISVSVERNSRCDDSTPPCNSEIRDLSVVLWRDGFFNTVDQAKPDAWPTDTDGTAVYGGAADLWGQSWTPAQINNVGFGVGIAARGTDAFQEKFARVDYVSVTITYTPADPTKVDTTTTVTCSTPVTLGKTSSCTATVTRASGSNTPSGNVNWGTSDSGHSTTFGPSACTQGTGTLTCTVSFTPSKAGTPTIQAVYPGDANFDGSSGETSVKVRSPGGGEAKSVPVPVLSPLGLLALLAGLGGVALRSLRRRP